MKSLMVFIVVLLMMFNPICSGASPDQHEQTPDNPDLSNQDCPWETAMKYRDDCEGLTAPRIIKKVDPVLPADFSTERAIYIYDALIARNGTVCGVKPVKSPEKPDEVLVNAYSRAIRQWTFEAAKKDGQSVDLILTISFRPEFR